MKNIVLIAICMYSCSLAKAQVNYQPQTIKVTGSAEKLVEPNEVHLIVQLIDLSGKKWNKPIAQGRNSFLEICESSGVKKSNIKLSNASSSLEQRLSLWRKTATNVRQREVYDIKFTDMDQMLNCIEKLDEPFVESLSFGKQTHTEITRYRKEVKESAAKAAIEKANYLASASGTKLGSVIYIEELIDTHNQGLANQYAGNVRYKKSVSGGGAKVNFGFKPMVLRYKVEIVCELR